MFTAYPYTLKSKYFVPTKSPRYGSLLGVFFFLVIGNDFGYGMGGYKLSKRNYMSLWVILRINTQTARDRNLSPWVEGFGV